MNDKNKTDLNHPFFIICALASCLIAIYETHNHINSKSENEGNM